MNSQKQQTFTLRIASSEITQTGTGTSSCHATVSSGASIDLAAAYRTSRLSAQHSLSSMRGLSAGSRFSTGASFYRRAG